MIRFAAKANRSISAIKRATQGEMCLGGFICLGLWRLVWQGFRTVYFYHWWRKISL